MLKLLGPDFTSSVTDPVIRSLVEKTFSEILDGEPYDYDQYGYMVVVEAGDSAETIERETQCSIVHDLFGEFCFGDPDFAPSFEFLGEHPTCYEMVFVLSDDGFGVDIFIPKTEGIDTTLLALCKQYAQQITVAT